MMGKEEEGIVAQVAVIGHAHGDRPLVPGRDAHPRRPPGTR
jgi:hypothetical protein